VTSVTFLIQYIKLQWQTKAIQNDLESQELGKSCDAPRDKDIPELEKAETLLGVGVILVYQAQ